MSPSKDQTFERIPLAVTGGFGLILGAAADVWAWNALLAGRAVAGFCIAVYFTSLAATGWHFQRTGLVVSGRINSLLWLGLTLLLAGCAAWLAWHGFSGQSQQPGAAMVFALIALILSGVFAFCCIVTHANVQCRKEELIKPPPPYEKLPPAKIPDKRN